MKILTAKFGGSSVADAEGFHRVRKIISGRICRKYIILSAPGRRFAGDDKITDLLLRGRTDGSARKLVYRRFSELAASLKLEQPENINFSADDAFIASRGEYLCAKLFADFADIPFADAADLIYFDAFGNTDLERTYAAIRRMTDRLPCAVIPGFYGSMPDGSIHTFPRNGSDITGALVAAGTGADLYENWSDVDGFMTADPRIVSNVVFNPNLSYRQMRSLSKEGAQVLHPDCLAPVSERGIPTLLKNTFDPEGAGTLISDDFSGSVPCVTGKDDFRIARVDHACMKALPDGVSYRCLQDISGNEYVLIKDSDLPNSSSGFTPVACICAFGVDAEKKPRILESVPHLHYFDEDGLIRFITLRNDFKSAVRKIHRILIG